MDTRPTATEKILWALSDSKEYLLEDLALCCHGLTWNQVFMEVDRLSRRGQVRLLLKGPGRYTVRRVNPDTCPAPVQGKDEGMAQPSQTLSTMR